LLKFGEDRLAEGVGPAVGQVKNEHGDAVVADLESQSLGRWGHESASFIAGRKTGAAPWCEFSGSAPARKATLVVGPLVPFLTVTRGTVVALPRSGAAECSCSGRAPIEAGLP